MKVPILGSQQSSYGQLYYTQMHTGIYTHTHPAHMCTTHRHAHTNAHMCTAHSHKFTHVHNTHMGTHTCTLKWILAQMHTSAHVHTPAHIRTRWVPIISKVIPFLGSESWLQPPLTLGRSLSLSALQLACLHGKGNNNNTTQTNTSSMGL